MGNCEWPMARDWPKQRDALMLLGRPGALTVVKPLHQMAIQRSLMVIIVEQFMVSSINGFSTTC